MASHSQSRSFLQLGGPKKPNQFNLPQTKTIPNTNQLLQTIDKRLDYTYTGMVKQEIKSLVPNHIFPNNVLYDYIRYIYDQYSIIDPLIKYDNTAFRGSSNVASYDAPNYQQKELFSDQIGGKYQYQYQPPLQKHQSFTFRQESSSSNLLNNSSGLQQNTSNVREPLPTQMIRTVPENNVVNTPYRSRNSLPLDYLQEQSIPQTIPHLHPHPSYQGNVTRQQEERREGVNQFINNPVNRFKSQINSELEQNRRMSPERIVEETNVPHRPKMLTLSSENKKRNTLNNADEVKQRLPETPLKQSFTDKSRTETEHRRRQSDNMPTTYSGKQRKSEEMTHYNFSISDRNPANLQEEHQRFNQGQLRRLEDRAGVSKSISFNHQIQNRLNPQNENIQEQTILNNYMRQQNPNVQTTNSVFLNQPYLNSQANYARSEAARDLFQTPARNFSQEKSEIATTARKGKRPNEPNSSESTNNRNINNEYSVSVSPLPNQYSNLEQIPSIYRYCFVCQHPILQYNIAVHQQKCGGFKDLYSKSFEQITQLIVLKIHKFEEEIYNILQDEEADRLKYLRSSVENWMLSIKNVPRTGENNLDMERKYSEIMKCFRSRELKLLQITHKLKWFLSIRQHIKQSFSI